MIIYIATYLAVMTAAGLAVCAHDKRAARRKKERVSERSLLALAALGGSLGVFAAMLLTRHKIRKTRFAVPVALIMLLQAAAVIYFINVF